MQVVVSVRLGEITSLLCRALNRPSTNLSQSHPSSSLPACPRSLSPPPPDKIQYLAYPPLPPPSLCVFGSGDKPVERTQFRVDPESVKSDADGITATVLPGQDGGGTSPLSLKIRFYSNGVCRLKVDERPSTGGARRWEVREEAVHAATNGGSRGIVYCRVCAWGKLCVSVSTYIRVCVSSSVDRAYTRNRK